MTGCPRNFGPTRRRTTSLRTPATCCGASGRSPWSGSSCCSIDGEPSHGDWPQPRALQHPASPPVPDHYASEIVREPFVSRSRTGAKAGSDQTEAGKIGRDRNSACPGHPLAPERGVEGDDAWLVVRDCSCPGPSNPTPAATSATGLSNGLGTTSNNVIRS